MRILIDFSFSWLYCQTFYEEKIMRIEMYLETVVLSNFLWREMNKNVRRWISASHGCVVKVLQPGLFPPHSKIHAWKYIWKTCLVISKTCLEIHFNITQKLYGWSTHWRWWWTFRRQCWSHLSAQSLCEPKKTSVPNSPHKLKSVSYNIFLHDLYWSVIGWKGHLVIVGIQALWTSAMSFPSPEKISLHISTCTLGKG